MSLDALLRPRSIAVIGASDNPRRIGGVPVDLLKRAGFERLYPVNPKHETIQGLAAFGDIESVPETVDLVIIALAAERTLAMLERCYALGITAAMVYASGYAETGETEGIARQDELAAFARRTGMRIAGPNAMGNANFTDQILTSFGQSFQPGEPAGNTAIVTQSGNMSSTLFRMAKRAGVTFSHVINTGNEASVELADYLDWLAEDPATSSVLCYIEQLRDGPKFLAAAERFRKTGKLLAAFKVGLSERGAQAARSHTAALVGNEAAYDAAFARAGVARASELGGLADLAYLHTLKDRIGGGNCAILSISGAAGAILADALEAGGMPVPSLPDGVQTALAAQIPGESMVSNPIDMTGNIVNANAFISECIRLALSPDEIDLLLLYTPGNFLTGALDQVEKAASENAKAIIVIDTFATSDREHLAAHGIGLFDDFDRAAKAICTYGKWKRHASQDRHAELVSASISDPGTAVNEEEWTLKQVQGDEQENAAPGWPALPSTRASLSETEAKEALGAFGVPTVQDALVQDRDDIADAADFVGYPLAAKLVSPDVAHKTEHGLIRLGLADLDDVTRAFDEMMEVAQAMGVHIEGVTLEPMLAGGVEILAGVTRDPVFGWLLTVGLGGVWTELMKDVAHALLPVDAQGAEALLRSLKGFKLLDGFRGAPKADVKAAAEAIAALGDAALAGGERLREVEINPLLVLPQGRGAVALDALVLLDDHGEKP
jgi:acyl-CoA synthetase (NDP forming)